MQIQIEALENLSPLPLNKDNLRQLIHNVTGGENLSIRAISVIFVNDAYIRKLHHKYLNDDRETDVMTFNLNNSEHPEAEIYISVDRAKAQAKEFGVTLLEEICRLIVHGMLHLKGYDDKSVAEQNRMREKEDYYLTKCADFF